MFVREKISVKTNSENSMVLSAGSGLGCVTTGDERQLSVTQRGSKG